jgi:coproporphyrinogen III oxidase
MIALAPAETVRGRATVWIEALHDELTALFTTLDAGGTFVEDRWTRDGGGGGVTRVLTDGATFERGGINRSVVGGALPPDAARRLGGRGPVDGDCAFFATGVSLVVHPRSPMVPTLHLNVRYFEVTDADGTPLDRWFGGGTDLTPFYPHEEDVRHFHRALRAACDGHHASLYPRFKPWCDRYFTNVHRGGEARGVGGIFFDHLRPGADESLLDHDGLFAFAGTVARSPATTYAPIVDRRRGEAYGDRERRFQLERRGRYVEFNLVHDRGTSFGLQTNGRAESILMSLPPLAAWRYDARYEPGTFEAALEAMLAPREWAARD